MAECIRYFLGSINRHSTSNANIISPKKTFRLFFGQEKQNCNKLNCLLEIYFFEVINETKEYSFSFRSLRSFFLVTTGD